MNKSTYAGLGVMAAASIAVIALADPAYHAISQKRLEAAAGGQETTVVTGEADGFGGPVIAEVTLAGEKIIALNLTGDGETPEIGGTALSTLKEEITANQGLDGVDAVSGATITSEGAFAAVRSAMGVEEQTEETTVSLEGLETTVVSGEAEGYGGSITAEVTLAEDKIVDLVLTGEKETPEIGGRAMDTLREAILQNQSLEGVDGVSGATWTSDGVFGAIRAALGEETGVETSATEQEVVTASGITHGLGFYSNGRLGPGKDDKGVGVYSLNEVVAYVLFDEAGRIVDLEVDQLEVATPNYDGEHMPHLTGFPGQGYHADLDHDEAVETVLEQDDAAFLKEVDSWKSKRERGKTYKLNSGTWEDEMDIFEEFFKGMTVEEIESWYGKYCSDVNGRPLFGTSENEKDVEKYQGISDADKAALDAVSGATMSLQDAHGDIIGAIARAYENRRPVAAEQISKIGLGFTNTGRVGPGKDDQGVAVYSFNTQAVGSCFDDAGRIVAIYTDVMEVATPNYDGEHMPNFTGFPGQSYSADTDHDEKVDTVLEQTEESFLAEVETWKTKRERGTTYKLNSGTWADEMDLFEEKFTGMTADETEAWFAAYCSELNGRPLHGTSDKEEDIKKYEALSQKEKAEMDAISGATMSLKDPHGDILGAIVNSWKNAKDTSISIN